MGKVGLDTQDRLVERLRQSPLLTKLCNEAASALGDRDAKIAELERENSELRTQDDPAFTYAFVLRAREAEAQVAELTQKLERATAVIDKLLDAALSNQSTASLKEGEEVVTDDDRAAYWKGAYDRMSARNIEQSNALDIAERALDDLANGRGLSTPIEKIIRDIQATAGRSM